MVLALLFLAEPIVEHGAGLDLLLRRGLRPRDRVLGGGVDTGPLIYLGMGRARVNHRARSKRG